MFAMNYFHDQSPASSPPAFLPGYLLGNGNASPSHSRQFVSSGQEFGRSPSHSTRPLFLTPQSTSNSRRQEFGASSGRMPSHQESPHHRSHSQHAKDKSGAPPTEGLFQHGNSASPDLSAVSPQNQLFSSKGPQMNTFDRGHPVATPYMTPGATTMDVCEDTPFNPRPSALPQSPAQLDPFYSQCESLTSDDALDPCTVTVFGFPSSAASYILQQFSLYGTIVKEKIPNDGNWMHLHYQTKIQAKKALSKNGKIFSNNLMIGVKPCIEMDFLKGSAPNPCGTPYLSQRESPVVKLQSVREDHASPRPASMRPLTAAYAASSGNKQIQQNNSTPQKQGGVVAKALDYMMGW